MAFEFSDFMIIFIFMANITTQVTSRGIISYAEGTAVPVGVNANADSLSESLPTHGTFVPTLSYRNADGNNGSAIFRWIKVGNLVTISGEVLMNIASSESYAHCSDLPAALVPVSRSYGPALAMNESSPEPFYYFSSGTNHPYAMNTYAEANPETWITGSYFAAITIAMTAPGISALSGSAMRIPFSLTYETE